MNRELLEAGFYFDAIGISPTASKRDILHRLMDIEREYHDDQKILDLLNKTRDCLIRKGDEYKEWILPCLDYVLTLIQKKCDPAVKEGIIRHGLLKIEKIEKWLKEEQDFKQNSEDPLGDRLSKLLKSVIKDDSILKSLFPHELDRVGALLENTPDYDYLYFDGECDNSAPSRKKAYEISLEAFNNLPDGTSLLSSLGFSLIQFGEYEKALECFKRQSKMSTEDGNAWNNIAWCLMRLGRYEEALTPCKRALKLLSNSSDVHYVYGSILTQLAHWDEAMKVIKNAISNLKPSDLELLELYYLLPSVLERKGDMPPAIIYWRQYLKLAKGKAGHERAVLRVETKLMEKGLRVSATSNEKRYPIRKISEDVFNEITSHINTILDIAKKHDIKPHQFVARNEIEQKQGALEPRCKRIFDEAFTIIKGLPSSTVVLGIGGEVKTLSCNDLYRELKREHESKGIPFCILIRDVVSRIIDDIPIFALPLTRTSLTSLKSEIKTIKNEMECINKMLEFWMEVEGIGEHLEPEAIKWLFSISKNFKVKDKVMSEIDVAGILDRHKKLFRTQTVGKQRVSQFDYSLLWIEELSKKLREWNQLLQHVYSSKQKDRDKRKDELSRKENEKNRVEKELKEKLHALERANRDNAKLHELLERGEDAIKSIMKLKKTGGIIAKLSGRRKKIEEAILQLETIRSQVKKLRPGILESVF